MQRSAQNSFPILFRKHPRARRYTLRLGRGGDVLVTVPRGGSQREALRFVDRHHGWISEQRARRAEAPGHADEWREGTRILFRGERVALELGSRHGRPFVEFGDQRVFIADPEMNLRRPVEARLLEVARDELPVRTCEVAREHGIEIARVSVRNQTSRWGSCSVSGVISLNWRLVQSPHWVRDYLIVHELMHRREMNHSIRFWRHVSTACPEWRQGESWLIEQALELGF